MAIHYPELDQEEPMEIDAKNGKLTGAPVVGAQYTYDGFPVSNAAAYSMSGAQMASPFAAEPKFVPFNNGLIGKAILRAADAIRKNPDKQVWAVELHNGEIALFVGDYGNVKAHVFIGAIGGSRAAELDPAFVNGTMADHNEVARSRGQPDPYPNAK